ncbi:MAG: STAS domain-containing protein [Chlorobiales bacterium]
MTFGEKQLGSVTVIELNGDVLGGPDANELHNKLRNLLNEGKKNIVIDLAKVEYMNSSGLGMMTSMLSTVKSAGGNLVLANPAERIKSLLAITKLNLLFKTFNDTDQAAAALN